MRTHTVDVFPPGSRVHEDESTSFPSAHPVGLRLGHVKGVTKPEQAERANGVYTEVSVCRQDPPPVGGFVFHGNYPGVEFVRPALAESGTRGWEHMTFFRVWDT